MHKAKILSLNIRGYFFTFRAFDARETDALRMIIAWILITERKGSSHVATSRTKAPKAVNKRTRPAVRTLARWARRPIEPESRSLMGRLDYEIRAGHRSKKVRREQDETTI